MNISFWKMHGARNDFIVVDDRDQTFPVRDTAWLRGIASRKTGIGCEGIILIQPSSSADFRMRFINPDGCEVTMCGNGARCVARLANDLGVASTPMSIETSVGLLAAEILGEQVRIELMPPHSLQLDGQISVDGNTVKYSMVNTGVPHVVVQVEDISSCDVQALGRAIRCHREFSPEGTNVNFISVTSANHLAVRTYERGVESETLACGTGVVAAALVAAGKELLSPPVSVTTAGGDTLSVDFKLTQGGVDRVFLQGPAACVYKGEVEYAGVTPPSRAHLKGETP